MSTFVCPECKEEIDESSLSCPQCGYPISDNVTSQSETKKKSKKIIAIIVSLLIVILLIAGGCVYFFTKMLPIQNSIKAYDNAVKYEEQLEYSAAISCYQDVIKEDTEHYQQAQNRVSALEKQLTINKFIAKAILALQNENMISSVEEITRIGAAISSSAHDYPMMTCKIGKYGYTVLDTLEGKDSSSGGDLANYYYDITTGLTIREYKASFKMNGFLTSDYNKIRQDTSDTIWEANEVFTDKADVNMDLVEHFLELYNNSNDLTVFD